MARPVGWYEPRPEGVWSTTRQAEALNLATTRKNVRHEGLVSGRNLMSNALVITDPFALYGSEIENINVAVVGDIGKAKSSLIKTTLGLRQIAAGRQVVVIDKKRQGDRGGEYTELAKSLGVPSIRFKTGGDGARLNIMDPAISSSVTTSGGIVPAGQEVLIAAVLEDTMQRTLVQTEIAALNLALRLVNERARSEAPNRSCVMSPICCCRRRRKRRSPSVRCGRRKRAGGVVIRAWRCGSSAKGICEGWSISRPRSMSVMRSTIRSCTSTCPNCPTRDRRCGW